MAAAQVPAAPPAPALADTLRTKIGDCFFYTCHPVTKEGIAALITWLLEECKRDKKAAGILLAQWLTEVPTL